MSSPLRRRSSSAEPSGPIDEGGPVYAGPLPVGCRDSRTREWFDLARARTLSVYAMRMNPRDCYDHVLGLRALRSFRDDPLSDTDIARLLEAARWTGSSKNLQNWSFVVVGGDQKERLADCGDFTGPVRAAPIVIALVEEPGGNEFDIGRVAQNLMLAADAIGIASCPITLHRSDETAIVLSLPKGARCRYAVALGYPSADAAPARFGGRKPMSEVAYRNRHGEAV